MGKRDRVDRIMVERGIVKSRERAQASIMAGRVTVGGVTVRKAGTLVDVAADIRLLEPDIPYVSRGGVKLEHALDHFGIQAEGKIVMDIGCSTGGFTDCVLQRNAARVYAVDVGYGQFDWSLRNDTRVVLLEKTNIRHLPKESVPDEIDLIVIDVSFISLEAVLPRACDFLVKDGEVLALVKPQFEVGKGMVGKGGIVRDETQRRAAVEKIRLHALSLGFSVTGCFESPIRGQKGNVEYFIHMRR